MKSETPPFYREISLQLWAVREQLSAAPVASLPAMVNPLASIHQHKNFLI